MTQWYPSDHKTRARVDQWLDWGQCRMTNPVIDVVLNTVFLGENGDQEVIQRGHQQLSERLLIMDAALENQPFLVGEHPTIADLSIASMVFHLGLAKASPTQPNIQSWFRRIMELQGFQRSLPPYP